jgi:thiosulfate/3-mercaptopyruvate sulfurtransferase
MNLSRFVKAGGVAILSTVCGLAGTSCVNGQFTQPAGSAASIPASALMQPQELNRMLQSSGTARPVILQVGSQVMFDQAHIPGAEYAGPGSLAAGMSLLRKRVAGLGRGKPIVIYCGCCPWNHCPNIWPAYKTLLGMGFTHVRALYLADNFGTDWVNKGYAVEGRH